MGRARDMGAIHPSEVKRMLHDILWNGLRKDLKDASGHKYDSIKDFDSLRVAIRQIEMKHTLEQQLYEKEKNSKPNPAKAAQVTPTTTEKSDIEELKGIVQQLVSTVDSYDRERQHTSVSYREPHRGYQQGYRGTYRHQDRTTRHDNNHNNNLTHNNKQLNNNIPSINIHPFTKNLNVLDVDNMDTIREDVV
jgi:hypothetical protein